MNLKPNALYVAMLAAMSAPVTASFLVIPENKASLPTPLMVIEAEKPAAVAAPKPAATPSVNEAKALASQATKPNNDGINTESTDSVAVAQTTEMIQPIAEAPMLAVNTKTEPTPAPVVAGEVQKISVHFPFGSTTFQPSDEAIKRINAAVQNIREINIAGYSDDRGTPEGNATAALRRALSARQYLMEKENVFEMRIKVSERSGQFIASNDTEEGRAKNRRVDMVFHPAIRRMTTSNEVLAVIEQPAPVVVANSTKATADQAEKPSSVVAVDTVPVATDVTDAPVVATDEPVVASVDAPAARKGFWASLFSRDSKPLPASESMVVADVPSVAVEAAPFVAEAATPVVEAPQAIATVTTVQPVEPTAKVTTQAPPEPVIEQQVIVAAMPPLPTQSPIKPTWTLRAGQPIHSQLQNWAAQAGWAFTWNMERSWIIPAEANFAGTFDEALEQVIVSLYMEGHPIRLAIWEGNRLAEVAIAERR